MRNQLLGLFVLRYEVVVHKRDKSIRMRIILELKVETVVHFSNSLCLFVRVMLQDQLFQVEESPFVVNSLSDLHLRNPSMRRVGLFTVVALEVRHNEFNLERLLEKGARLDFFLDSQLDFDASGVWFSPNESSVHQFYSFESFNIFEANREKFSGFQLARGPWGTLVTIALATMLQNQVLRDTFCNVNLAL